MHRLRILTFALALGACSGSSGPTGPAVIVLLGSWSLEHTFTLLTTPVATCPGAMTVNAQSESAFSGDIIIDAGTECAGVAGVGAVSGTAGGGTIAFSIQGLGLNDLLAQIDCDPISATAFGGAATETAFTAVSTQVFTCLDPDTNTRIPVQIQWHIAGQKVGG